MQKIKLFFNISILGFFLFSTIESALGSGKDELPNIVLILADDMGVGEPSYAGGLVPTPALNQLANEGMRFTDAHTSSSVCTPTRYGILTGRYNWRSRLKESVLFDPTDPGLMDPQRLNMPQFLQDIGYHTSFVGKWHLGVDWVMNEANVSHMKQSDRDQSWTIDYSKPFRKGPIDIGFDNAFFILSSLDMAPYVYLRGDQAVAIPTVNKGWEHNEYNDYTRIGAAVSDFEASECLEDWTEESLRIIRGQSETPSSKPFFLYLPLTSPHTPVVPGEKFKGRYNEYSLYADFIAETDWVVGQILEELELSGLSENTIVIFTSDNGFAPYVEIPRMIEAGYRPSGEYRGAKASIYEGGHRVPFLVRWPGRVRAGSESDVTICTTDFFATFADIIGDAGELPEDAAEDSFSFYPALKGSDEAIRPFTIHHSIKGKFAIRKGDWKLVLTDGMGGGWDLPWETTKTTAKLIQLYNLKNDPTESNNLEGQHPEIVNELVGDLSSALHEGRTTPGEKQTNDGWPYIDSLTMEHYPQLSDN